MHGEAGGAILPLDADAGDLDAWLALNNAHAAELSWLERHALRAMIETSFAALRIGQADAFLLAFDQDADYDSVNFRWFQARLPRFVYVDRIAVAPHARGRGLARRLYAALFSRSAEAGHTTIACEVNSTPPNPASDAFHASLGFAVAGSAAIHGGEKTVRYLTRAIGKEEPVDAGP